MRALSLLVVITCLPGCASLGGESGGGSKNLPVSGGGPFRPLVPDPDIEINAPFVLQDNLTDLDDPSVLAEGDALALWVTSKRRIGASTVTRIEHADAPLLTRGFGDLQVSLEASQPWEGGAVSAPSVLRDGATWILFYAGGGSIGYAVGQDDAGHLWQKAPGPTLIANNAEEGTALASPTAVRVGDKLRLFYLAGGLVWAAEAPFADVAAGRAPAWTRVDADVSTPVRDPVLRGAPFAIGLGRVWARSALTPAGRVRHDLYFTALTATEAMSTVGFASTHELAPYDLRYQVAPLPILPVRQTTRSGTMTPYGAGALLLYVQRLGSRDSIAAGLSP
jgi:hypothetical protein